MVERKGCLYCGKPTFPTMRKNSLFCGMECENKLRYARKRGERIERRQRLYAGDKRCRVCQGPIPLFQYHKRVTCSPECSKQNHINLVLEKQRKIRESRPDDPDRLCALYGCHGIVKGWRPSFSKFCSKKCKNKAFHLRRKLCKLESVDQAESKSQESLSGSQPTQTEEARSPGYDIRCAESTSSSSTQDTENHR